MPDFDFRKYIYNNPLLNEGLTASEFPGNFPLGKKIYVFNKISNDNKAIYFNPKDKSDNLSFESRKEMEDYLGDYLESTGGVFKEEVNEAPIKRKKGVELTYGQARANQETDKAIHNHIKKNYPDDYNPGVSRFHGGGKVGMLGKQGHGLVPSNIMKITRFAKLKNDKKLLGLVDQWVKIARDNNIID